MGKTGIQSGYVDFSQSSDSNLDGETVFISGTLNIMSSNSISLNSLGLTAYATYSYQKVDPRSAHVYQYASGVFDNESGQLVLESSEESRGIYHFLSENIIFFTSVNSENRETESTYSWGKIILD